MFDVLCGLGGVSQHQKNLLGYGSLSWITALRHQYVWALGPIQPPVSRVPFLFLGVKAAGAWPWSSSTSKAEIRERV